VSFPEVGSVSFIFVTFMPFLLGKAQVIPSPTISLPEKGSFKDFSAPARRAFLGKQIFIFPDV
jgi:hypothetical protein